MYNSEELYIGVRDKRNKNGDDTYYGGIIIDKNNSIMFKIKILNSINDSSKAEIKEKSISVFPQSLFKMGFEDDLSLGEETRKINLIKYLDNRIFLFQVYSETSSYDDLKVKDIESMVINRDFNESYEFEPVPIFKDIDDKITFEDKLINKEYLRNNSVKYLSDNLNNISSFAIHEKEESSYDFGFLYENVDAIDLSNDSICYDIPTKNNYVSVRKIDTDKMSNGVYRSKQGIMFIPTEYLLADNIDKYSKIENNIYSDKISTVNNIDSEDFDDIFIRQFKNVISTNEYKLVISDNDLINFHTSVKSNLLTIVSGLSGTGKSRIINAYAESIGISNNSNEFKFIPVRPFWQDDADLLGFVDNMSNNYHPGDTGMVETIIDAQKEENRNKIYLIVLDEMNLARVEHYFSQFLSILERNPEDRYINLYNKHIEPRLYNSYKYPSKIMIPNNIRFIGTMNVDDSTFELSDKLLDRANVIQLQLQPFFNRIKDQFLNGMSIDNLKNGNFIKFDSVLFSHKNDFQFNENQLNFLWDLHLVINNEIPSQGISWRTINSIENFIRSMPKNNLDVKSTLDRQLTERVFTKLRGTDSMLSRLISIDDNGNLTGKISNLLNKSSDISDFKISNDALLIKVKELNVNGFAR